MLGLGLRAWRVVALGSGVCLLAVLMTQSAGCGAQSSLPQDVVLDTWTFDGTSAAPVADQKSSETPALPTWTNDSTPSDTQWVYDPSGVDGQVAGEVVVRTDGPILHVSADGLNFGSATSQLSIAVRNDGSGVLTYAITSGVAWATVSPGAGDSTGESDVIAVTVDRAGMSAGTYNGVLQVSGDDGQVHQVTLWMQVASAPPPPSEPPPPPTEPGVLELSTDTLDFGADDTTLSLTLLNAGTGPLAFTIEPDAEWLAVAPESGTLEAGKSVQASVVVDREALDAGAQEASLVVAADDGSVRTVAVYVAPRVHLWSWIVAEEWHSFYRDNLDDSTRPRPVEGLTLWLSLTESNLDGSYRGDGSDGVNADPAAVVSAIQEARARGYRARPGITRIFCNMNCVHDVAKCEWRESTKTLTQTLWYRPFEKLQISGEFAVVTIVSGTGVIVGEYTVTSKTYNSITLDRSIGAAADGQTDIHVRFAEPSDMYYGHGKAYLQYVDPARWEGVANAVAAMLPQVESERIIELDFEPWWDEGDGVGEGRRYPSELRDQIRDAAAPLLDVLSENSLKVYCWPGVPEPNTPFDFPMPSILAEVVPVTDIDEVFYDAYYYPQHFEWAAPRRARVNAAGRDYLPCVYVQVLRDAHRSALEIAYEDYSLEDLMIFIDGAYPYRHEVFTDKWYRTTDDWWP